MNEKEQLLKEIEQAPDYLIEEVLNFLLLTKNSSKKQANQASLEKQLQAMAEDPEIQIEITNIEREFSISEMDGLN
jgi:predicted amino acid-binding ACT domain protein